MKHRAIYTSYVCAYLFFFLCLSILCVFWHKCHVPSFLLCLADCFVPCGLACIPSVNYQEQKNRRWCFGSIAPDNLGFGRSWRNYLLTLQRLQPSPQHFVIRHLKQFLGVLKHDSSSLPGLHISVNDPKVWSHPEKD